MAGPRKRKRNDATDGPSRRRSSSSSVPGPEPNSGKNEKDSNNDTDGEIQPLSKGRTATRPISRRASEPVSASKSVGEETDQVIMGDSGATDAAAATTTTQSASAFTRNQKAAPLAATIADLNAEGNDHAEDDGGEKPAVPQQEEEFVVVDETEVSRSSAQQPISATVPSKSANRRTSVTTSTVSTRKAAVAASKQLKQPPNKNAASLSERTDQLKSLLLHRKLLLKRLQQGRAVARQRLELLDKESPTTMTSDEQVIAFREGLRQATSVARKQKSEGEKRAPLSLRRGSSVGKRMNAALSSLAPGQHAATSGSVAVAPAAAAATAPLASALPPAARPPPSAAIGVAPKMPPGKRVGGAGIVRPASVPLKSSKSNRAAAASAATNPLAARGVSAMGTAATALSSKMSLQQMGMKAAPAMLPPMNRQLLLQQQLQQQQQQQQQKQLVPAVVCPEAIALRERRNAAANKLTALLEKRLQVVDSSSSNNVRSPARGRVSNQTRQAFLRGPELSPPQPLPRRRKTNWDYLLEEMRWMATGFIEERKWKVSAARVIAQNVATRELPCHKETVLVVSGEKPAAFAPRIGDKVKVDSSMERITRATGRSKVAVADGGRDRSYVSISPADTAQAVSVAKQISAAFSDQVTLLGNMSTWKSLRFLDDSLTGESVSPRNKKTASADNKGDDPETLTIERPTVDGASMTKKHRKALYDQITQVIKQVEEKTAETAKSKPGPATLKTHGVALSTDQSKVLDLIEDCWSRVGAGTVLKGTHASGKTVLACSLLWRHRTHGPQLVLSSANSLVRWAHELECFKWLKISIFEEKFDLDSLGRGDILVCDLLALHKLSKLESVRNFQSILVDCRCATGFEGSRLQTCLPQRKVVPPETFMAPDWWQALLSVAMNVVDRRLIIENKAQDDVPNYVDGLPMKLSLEISAWRAAFLLRSPVPEASKMTAAKALLAWARRNVMKSEDENIVLSESARKLLASSVESLHFSLSTSPELSSSLFSLKDAIVWDARLCKMPAEQAEAYSRCCAELQTSLQSSLYSRREEWDGVSDALLRLRRHCSHSDLQGFMSGSICWFDSGSYILGDRTLRDGRALSCSPSQSSKEVVSRILLGSSKFQELLSILIEECGFELAEFRLHVAMPRSTDKLKRIAILAALPEVQIMTSLLLNCMGVDHELLPRTDSASQAYGANIWAEHQAILSTFNGDISLKGSSAQIIVGSVETVAGNLGGLSIEGADLVVCLDEDWSGRGEMLLYSILARSLKRREMTGSYPCRFIRLITAETCEASFLKPADPHTSNGRRTGGKSRASKEKLPMRLNPVGLFDVVTSLSADQKSLVRDCWRTRTPGTTYFVFPGSNLSALRDTKLTEVLGTGFIPPLLTSSKDPLFLPVETSEDQILDEIGFLSSLLEKERSMYLGPAANRFTNSRGASSLILTHNEENKLYPCSVAMYLDRIAVFNGSRSIGLSIASPALSAATLSSEGKAVLPTKKGDGDDSTRVVPPGSTAVSSSLLFYPFLKEASIPAAEAATDSRANIYASSYGLLAGSIKPVDGNQGKEPLVYVPPLFPRILESSRLARSDEELLKSRAAAVEGQKRVAVDDPSSIPLAKRPRQDAAVDGASEESVAAPEQATGVPETIETREGNSTNDSSSVLLDLSNDYGLGGTGAVPLPRDSALSAAYTFVENSAAPDGNDAIVSTEWFSSTEACDTEEVALASEGRAPMKSMILFVSRKRPRGYNGRPITTSQLSRNTHGAVMGNIPWFGNPASSFTSTVSSGPNSLVTGAGVAGAGARLKKKPPPTSDNPLVPSSAFSRLPGMDTPVVPRPSGHPPGPFNPDLYKKGLLSNIRQSGTGATLFEDSSFRTASLQAKNRVSNRLIRYCWTSSSSFEAGPGLPLHIAKPQSAAPKSRADFEVDTSLWTSIVKKPSVEYSRTGSDALELSALQRAAFHASLVSPCRVDFGPFQSGFLSMPSGMTAITQPRSRAGVSLPMGVKISPIPKEQSPTIWAARDDELLEQSLVKYGMNWMLAARSLLGFQEFRFVPQQGSDCGAVRSCRDRWHSLVRKDTSLSNRILHQEQHHRSVFTTIHDFYEPGTDGGLRSQGHYFGYSEEQTDGDATKKFDKPPTLFLVPNDRITEISAKGSEPSSGTKKLSFVAFGKAKGKVLKTPLPIHGVTSGSPPSASPSHASHMQAVEAAVASNSNARKDMWPLQLLAANRKRDDPALATSASLTEERFSSATAEPQGAGSSPSSRAPNSSKISPTKQEVASSAAAGLPGRSSKPTSRNSTSSNATAQSFAPPASQSASSVSRPSLSQNRKPGT